MQQDLNNVQDLESERLCQTNDFDSQDCNFEELNKPITFQEVKEIISSLKRNKSFAGDKLLNEYFIESLDILLAILLTYLMPF